MAKPNVVGEIKMESLKHSVIWSTFFLLLTWTAV